MAIEKIISAWVIFISEFSVGYILEFLAFACLIYFVCSVLKKNKAINALVIYLITLLFYGVMCFFIPQYSAVIYLMLVLLESLFLLMLFATEIKRGIWAVANRSTSNNKDMSEVDSLGTEACIDSIIKACQNMSKNDVGALIILSNGNMPDTVLDSGTYINADISQPMIEGIFFPKSPLHDGALIIEDHKLLAAGCFLPLTQKNEEYEQELGTRHRAGIGITEVTNVTVIIVSEETGIISIVKQGKITRYADYSMLYKELRDYYWKDFISTEDSHGKKSFKMPKEGKNKDGFIS